MPIPEKIRAALAGMEPRRRQWLTATAVIGMAIFILWLVLTLGAQSSVDRKRPQAGHGKDPLASITNIMPPGAQIKPEDEWMGDAGRKLAQYEADRTEQDRKNKEAEDFQKKALSRFADLERILKEGAVSAVRPSESRSEAPRPVPAAPQPAPYPPATAMPGAVASSSGLPPPPKGAGTIPTGKPFDANSAGLVRVTVVQPVKSAGALQPSGPGQQKREAPYTSTLDSYLPVSVTRGIMLGGLDAPTGGQAQSNPHPVLIRLDDDAILPNRYRSNIRECFVVAAGYGDISSERAYLRTENLSCVRNDGTVLEIKIQGTIYGEDGLVGVRGKLVTKQGSILANALLAGLLNGIGRGMAQSGNTVSQTPFGTITTTDPSHAFRQGLGEGIGGAMDRLANYYIRLAEQVFPVIEVQAGRKIDVVITKGARIEGGEPSRVDSVALRQDRNSYGGSDDDY